MRKVKLPEVPKEEAEASLMVLFTTPLQRLGLADAHKQRQTNSCYKESILHAKQCRAERSTIVLRENVIDVCRTACVCDIIERRKHKNSASIRSEVGSASVCDPIRWQSSYKGSSPISLALVTLVMQCSTGNSVIM